MRNISSLHFNTARKLKIVKDFITIVITKLGVAGVLYFINPFLGIWLGTSALMLGGFAGGVRLLPTFNGRTSKGSRNTGRQLKISERVSGRNHARSYRRSGASRPAFAGGGGGDSDGGSESDSGDPAGANLLFPPFLSFPVTQFQKFYRKRNSYFLISRCILYTLGSWRLLSCHCSLGVAI